ncbi:MAG: peptide deformylase [Proteobacteria bacterium]|nr:peptide deformylase [Pseudomonadota bacterium]
MSDILRINTDDASGTQIQQVKVLPLVPENDPILDEVMPEFDFSNPPVDPTFLASQLVETCIYHKGLGLSANQCGLKHRVFVMGAGNEYVAHFNPKIISTSPNTAHMEEGCLSYPFLFVHITRPESIQVEYQDHEGNVKKAIYSGITARCFQHELDHMNGVRYVSKAKPLALKTAKKKKTKLLERYRKANERLAARVRTGLPQRA